MIPLALVLLALGAQEDVEDLIARLGDESIERRVEAAAALRRIGAPALPALEKALASTTHAEIRGRLADLVSRLRCGDQGGEVVDGLRLHLALETPEAREGGDLKARLTLWNVTPTPRRLTVGYSATGNYFELGLGLLVTAPGHETPGTISCNVMVCGTGAVWMEETIPPYRSKSYVMKARLESQDGARRYLLKGDWFTLRAPPGPLHRLRFRHEPRHQPLELEPGTRPWAGKLLSNEVELKIVP